jgi:hypothetical protein
MLVHQEYGFRKTHAEGQVQAVGIGTQTPALDVRLFHDSAGRRKQMDLKSGTSP